MKNKRLILGLLALLLVFVACSPKEESKDLETIKVASHTSPMTDILLLMEEQLNEKGYTLELVEVSDNVQANIALQNEEVDANFFQHEPFMQMFNQGNDGNLVRITPVYNALVAFYSKDYNSIEELPNNAVISIPNDPTNRTRALRLLAKSNAITLSDPDSYNIQVEDIKTNDKNFEFKEWGLLNLNEAYQESDLVFNYPTYIDALDLRPTEDGLLLESVEDQVFAISLVARENNQDNDKVKALKEAINSDEVKQFIEKELDGHAKVAF